MGDDNIADSAVTGAAAGGNNIKVVCRFRYSAFPIFDS